MFSNGLMDNLFIIDAKVENKMERGKGKVSHCFQKQYLGFRLKAPICISLQLAIVINCAVYFS
jgi:hypothetical protein